MKHIKKYKFHVRVYIYIMKQMFHMRVSADEAHNETYFMCGYI